MNAAQRMLLLASLWYLASGAIYSYRLHHDLTLSPLIAALALAGIVLGIWVTRRSGDAPTGGVRPLPAGMSLKIALFAFGMIAITVGVYLIIDPAYFGSDKLERAATVSQLFRVRFIAFTSCALLAILVIRWNSCTAEVKYIVMLSYLLMLVYAVVELNRELFLILGLSYYLYRNFNVQRVSIRKMIAYSLVVVPLFLMFKFAAYWIFFDKIYDGGLFSVGELVNWSRWTDLALQKNLDLAQIQSEDIGYLITALVYPFSNHEISSEVFFREVLGQSGVGRSVGYSGPLWAYGYMDYMGVFIFYFLLGSGTSLLNIGKTIYRDVLVVAMIFVMFRFFRQEWVIPVKTILWVYLYPSIMLIFLSKLKIVQSSIQPLAERVKDGH